MMNPRPVSTQTKNKTHPLVPRDTHLLRGRYREEVVLPMAIQQASPLRKISGAHSSCTGSLGLFAKYLTLLGIRCAVFCFCVPNEDRPAQWLDLHTSNNQLVYHMSMNTCNPRTNYERERE